MRYRAWAALAAALMISGCGRREQINIERNVQAQPAPDTAAHVVSDQPGTLAAELDAKREQSQAKQSPESKQINEQAMQKLADSGILDQALNVGDTIPEFTLESADRQPASSREFLEKGPLVITFYRGGWCPYCNLALRSLQKSQSDVEAAGATLVAISPETQDKASETRDKDELSYFVLSDPGNKLAAQFGLAFTLDPALQEKYKGFGAGLPEWNGDESWTLPLPATYVVDQQGKVRWRFVDVDYTKRAEPAEIVAAVQAITRPTSDPVPSPD